MAESFYKFWADFILVLHFGIVTFLVLGLLLVWLGYFRRWRVARNGWFRLFHLLTMGAVAAQAVFGQICPLTIWENHLREVAGAAGRYEATFIQHWVGRVLFYDLDPVAFTIAYVVFFAAIALSWLVVKPEPIRFRRRRNATSVP
jgi:uncharacterized protein DUF2784